MTATTTPDVQTEASDALLDIIRQSPKPLSHTQILAKYQGPKRTKAQLKAAIVELASNGKIFNASPQGRTPRVWNHDETQMVLKAATEVADVKPLTLNALRDAVKKEVKSGASNAWLETTLKQMLADGQLHAHPGTTTNGPKRYGTHAFDPFSIPPKASLMKEFAKYLTHMATLGVEPNETCQHLIRLMTVKGATPQAAEEPTPAPTDELGDLLIKTMYEIEPDLDDGRFVYISELRHKAALPKNVSFDDLLLQLAMDKKVSLFVCDEPYNRTERERSEMLQDQEGNYFITVALRK